ncbi:MAG: hypothetical protein RL318_1769 [Fibrobacterota bacterium]
MARNGLNMDIGVRVAPERRLACVHHRGPYVGNVELFEGLFARVKEWAAPLGLVGPEQERIAVFHNDPEITPPDLLQMSVGIVIPEEMPVQEGIEVFVLPEGTYAVATGSIHIERHGQAWWLLMGEWLPRSGWKPAPASSFEVVRQAPSDHDGMHHVELWVPVMAV